MSLFSSDPAGVAVEFVELFKLISITFPLLLVFRWLVYFSAKRSVLHGVIVGLLRLNIQKQAMSGYTPDEKLRVEQITKLRRQWLKDQELSPREPVVQAKPPGAVAKFWAGFLEPKSLWRLYVSPDTQLMLASKTTTGDNGYVTNRNDQITN